MSGGTPNTRGEASRGEGPQRGETRREPGVSRVPGGGSNAPGGTSHVPTGEAHVPGGTSHVPTDVPSGRTHARGGERRPVGEGTPIGGRVPVGEPRPGDARAPHGPGRSDGPQEAGQSRGVGQAPGASRDAHPPRGAGVGPTDPESDGFREASLEPSAGTPRGRQRGRLSPEGGLELPLAQENAGRLGAPPPVAGLAGPAPASGSAVAPTVRHDVAPVEGVKPLSARPSAPAAPVEAVAQPESTLPEGRGPIRQGTPAPQAAPPDGAHVARSGEPGRGPTAGRGASPHEVAFAESGPRPEPHGPVPAAARPARPAAPVRVETPTVREQVPEPMRELVEEGQRRTLVGTMQTSAQGSSAFVELERRRTPGGETGGSSSSSSGSGGSGGNRVVEVREQRDQGGGGGGRGEGGMGGGAGSGAGRGVNRLEQGTAVPQPIEMARAGRAAIVQQTAEQRALAQKIVMARIENKEPVVLEKAVAHHATSVIGVILKKAYPDEKQREKDASKLVALILRSHGFYTYEHCTRLIDLASDLASMTGKKDPDTQRNIADGIMYRDLGEVEYLLSKGTPRQRQVITEYLAGQKMAQAGLLHDIGKIKVPKEILYKPGMLTPDEAKIMQLHPVYGAEILESIPPLAHAAPAARHHHERYDGKGYPDRLKGEQIPYEARVIAIVDCFDAMAADRPYRKGLPLDVCRSELVKGKGKQFDPDLVDAFMEVLDAKFVRGHMSMEDYKLGPGA